MMARITTAARGSLPPVERSADSSKGKSNDVRAEVASLVSELTNKVLMSQPGNVAQFCADFLEEKLRKREEETKKIDAHRLFRLASFTSKFKSEGRVDQSLTGTGVSNAVQDVNPQKDQVTLPEVGGRGVGDNSGSKVTYTAPSNPCRHQLEGHMLPVTHCATVDKYLITSSMDRTLKVWEISRGRLVASFTCHEAVLTFVCVKVKHLHRKVLVLAGCQDGRVPTWVLNLEGHHVTGECTNMLSCHLPNPIRTMALSPDHKYLATGCCFFMDQVTSHRTVETSVRGTLKTWVMDSVYKCTVQTGKCEMSVQHHGIKTMKQLVARVLTRMASYSHNTKFEEEKHFGIRALCFSPDSKYIVAGFGHPEEIGEKDFKMVVVCNADTLDTVWADGNRHYQVTSLSFSNHGLGTSWSAWQLLLGTQGHMFAILLHTKESSNAQEKDILRPRYLWQRRFEENNSYCAIYSPDGALVASVRENVVCLWDAKNGALVAEYQGHSAKVNWLCFTTNGRYICSCCQDGEVRIWRSPSTGEPKVKDKHEGQTVTSRVKTGTSSDQSQSRRRSRETVENMTESSVNLQHVGREGHHRPHEGHDKQHELHRHPEGIQIEYEGHAGHPEGYLSQHEAAESSDKMPPEAKGYGRRHSETKGHGRRHSETKGHGRRHSDDTRRGSRESRRNSKDKGRPFKQSRSYSDVSTDCTIDSTSTDLSRASESDVYNSSSTLSSSRPPPISRASTLETDLSDDVVMTCDDEGNVIQTPSSTVSPRHQGDLTPRDLTPRSVSSSRNKYEVKMSHHNDNKPLHVTTTARWAMTTEVNSVQVKTRSAGQDMLMKSPEPLLDNSNQNGQFDSAYISERGKHNRQILAPV